jgi:hypothetical protein
MVQAVSCKDVGIYLTVSEEPGDEGAFITSLYGHEEPGARGSAVG